MTCLDSDVLVDFLKKRPDAIELLTVIEARDGILRTTAINSFEVLSGISIAAESKKYDEAIQFFSRFTVFDLTFEVSQKAAEIYEGLKSKGLLIDTGDILIAAIVLANNETLVTRNTKHFERIPGLRLEPLR